VIGSTDETPCARGGSALVASPWFAAEAMMSLQETFRFCLCLVLLAGGITIGDAFLRPSARGSVVLSDALPAAAQPTRLPDYSGQALKLGAGKISGAINGAANGPQATPKLQTPPKAHAAELPIAAGAVNRSETTSVAPVENVPSPSVPVIDTGSRMTLGGPIMVPVGVMEEDGDRPHSPVIGPSPFSSDRRYTCGCFARSSSNAHLRSRMPRAP
jgi:hypothetical protein